MEYIDDAMTQIAQINKQIANYVDEYVRFMGIKHFPTYDLKFKKVSLSKADSQGFDSLASTAYDVNVNNHTLCIATNLPLAKYVLFHEFTHMLDSEEHTDGNKNRYAGLFGYTEYHASQVELMQLLGAKSIEDIPSFSMNSVVHTLAGEKRISQYVYEKQMHAIELFSRSDFPASIDTLKSAVGVLHNYWGLRSICEMYAADFVETVDNSAFLKFIPTMHFSALNRLMHGWMDKTKIDLSIPVCYTILISLIQDFKLI